MSKKAHQITYISALIIMIGSTIGAGIFFKNGSLFSIAQGNLGLVIASWCVAGVGMVALGLAIVEMTSVQKSNRGTLEWFKQFMPSWLAKSAKNYVQLIFIPITLFTMPIYVVSSFWDAGWVETTGWLSFAIAFLIFMWIAGISLVSLKASERLQWVLTAVKFLPVIILPLIAFANSGDDAVGSVTHKAVDHETGLMGVAPEIIIIGGIPAISFAFDGFYEVTSLKQDLDQPKKLGSVVVLGLAIIFGVYIFLTIAFAFGSNDGTHFGIPSLSDSEQAVFNTLIGIGVIGIINGYMMSSVRQNASLHADGESPAGYFMDKALTKVFKRKFSSKFVAWFFIVFSTTIFFIIFGMVGMYGWSTDGGYGENRSSYLYGFCDILVNYTSLAMFSLISIAVLGALTNRFTNKVQVEKRWYFVPAAITSSLILLSSAIFMFVVGIVDATGFNGADQFDAMIKLIVFGSIIGLSVVFGLLEHYLWKPTKEKIKEDTVNVENNVDVQVKI